MEVSWKWWRFVSGEGSAASETARTPRFMAADSVEWRLTGSGGVVFQVKEQQRDCKDTVNRMVGNSVVMGKMEEKLKVGSLLSRQSHWLYRFG